MSESDDSFASSDAENDILDIDDRLNRSRSYADEVDDDNDTNSNSCMELDYEDIQDDVYKTRNKLKQESFSAIISSILPETPKANSNNISSFRENQRHKIYIEDYDFHPNSIEVIIGDEIEILLSDSVPPHAEHVIEGSGEKGEIFFTSPLLQIGEDTSFAYIPLNENQINLSCKIYDDMYCSIVVSNQLQTLTKHNEECMLGQESNRLKNMVNMQDTQSSQGVSTDCMTAPSNQSTQQKDEVAIHPFEKFSFVSTSPFQTVSAPSKRLSSASQEIRAACYVDDNIAQTILIDDFRFLPAKVSICAGKQLAFVVQSDVGTHKLTCEGEFSSVTIDAASTPVYLHTFKFEGRYKVVDEIFSFMTCTIEVTPNLTSLTAVNLTAHKKSLELQSRQFGNEVRLEPLTQKAVLEYSQLRGSFVNNYSDDKILQPNSNLLSLQDNSALSFDRRNSYIIAAADGYFEETYSDDVSVDDHMKNMDENHNISNHRENENNIEDSHLSKSASGISGVKKRNIKKKLKQKQRAKDKCKSKTVSEEDCAEENDDKNHVNDDTEGVFRDITATQGLEIVTETITKRALKEVGTEGINDASIMDSLQSSLEAIKLIANTMRRQQQQVDTNLSPTDGAPVETAIAMAEPAPAYEQTSLRGSFSTPPLEANSVEMKIANLVLSPQYAEACADWEECVDSETDLSHSDLQNKSKRKRKKRKPALRAEQSGDALDKATTALEVVQENRLAPEIPELKTKRHMKPKKTPSKQLILSKTSPVQIAEIDDVISLPILGQFDAELSQIELFFLQRWQQLDALLSDGTGMDVSPSGKRVPIYCI